MHAFFAKLLRRPVAKPANNPPHAEIIAALSGGEHTPELAAHGLKHQMELAAREVKHQVALAAREKILAAREEVLRPLQKPGELWLHTPQGPALAVARYPGLLQLAGNDNKLVNGHAGSGRTVLLARLAKTAHAAGKVVVILDSDFANPDYCGPLESVNRSLNGGFLPLDTPEQQRFNPFHMPGEEGQGWCLRPSLEQVDALAHVLVGVLRLTCYASTMPVQWPAQRLKDWLYEALGEYYAAQADEASNYPTFAAFAAFVDGRRTQDGRNAELLEWFAQVSQPFLAGGELSTLLSGELSDMVRFAAPNRFLNVTIRVDKRAASAADTPGFSGLPYATAAPEALTRGLLLTLHSLDSFLGGKRERPLTIILDELRYESLGPITADYLDGYLRHGYHYHREVIAGWHESPAAVFTAENPAALMLLSHCGTQLLVRAPAQSSRLNNYGPLDFSPEEREAFAQEPVKRWSVLIRRPLEDFGVFDMELSRLGLADFVAPGPRT